MKRSVLFLIIVGFGLTIQEACAVTRAWTGNANGNWSNPNNWNPVGVPQDGEDPDFYVDSHTSMLNDLPNLSVRHLNFNYHDYSLAGNPLTIGGTVDIMGYDAHSVTINCALILGRDTRFEVGNTGISTRFRVNADINLNRHALSMGVSGGGHIELAGSISGDGDVELIWPSSVGGIEFLGTAENTLTGGASNRQSGRHAHNHFQ